MRRSPATTALALTLLTVVAACGSDTADTRSETAGLPDLTGPDDVRLAFDEHDRAGDADR